MSLLEDLKKQLQRKTERVAEADIPAIRELDAVELRMVAGGHGFLQYGAFEQIVA